ncbi:MAG: pyruvate synthase [Candidatus Iainarchaeum archaeon]|uniref:Pyruvate synthase n=1 Tax=Candidatus Iainarchaeum sp. TaxID=3101447 RepID=A0A497JI22_9ARCH|nr:MAG: pyruvate synthase [Candidatus Diapherotrites archaeon]
MSEKKFTLGGIMPSNGSTRNYKTGSWRSYRPIINHELCKKCGRCYAHCPDNAIKKVKDRFEIDYDYCKGCGICYEECPFNAIKMVLEEK